MALEGPVNQEDVLKMVENDYTIEIPNHALEKGKMLPYLRSLTRYIDRQPITKFRSSAFKFAEEDFDLNVAANVTTKKFHGFKNSPVSNLQFMSKKEQIIQEYIWEQLKKEEKHGYGNVRNFFESSYKKQTFQYMENYEHPEKIFDLNKYGCNWNLAEESNLPNGLSGISSPWFYIGSRYSVFPLHVEDNNLRSLNIHLGGAPKVWIAFHLDDCSIVEQILQQFKPAKECLHYHRHKQHFINPAIFTKIKETVPVYSVIQYPGEMILTNSFHQGFNLGINYNIAINFMLDSKDFRMSNSAGYCGADCKYDEKGSILEDIRLGYCLTCDFCSKKFTSHKGLKKHYINQHGKELQKGAKLGECGLCKKSFSQPENHLKNYHILDLPYEMCGLCRSKFKNQTEVRKHWKRVHSKNRTCKFCEKTFDRLQDAQYHECKKEYD